MRKKTILEISKAQYQISKLHNFFRVKISKILFKKMIYDLILNKFLSVYF
jgi:hypothetical protein